MFVPSYFCFAAKHFADDDYKVEHLLISNEENIAKSLCKYEADSAHRLMFVSGVEPKSPAYMRINDGTF